MNVAARAAAARSSRFSTALRTRILCGMANEVIQWTLEEFERGLDAGPTADDVSVTVDGRRLDSKSAVLDWWAEVAADVEAEETARQTLPGA